MLSFLVMTVLILGVISCNLMKLDWKSPFSSPLDDLPLDELPDIEELPTIEVPDLDDFPTIEVPELDDIPIEVPPLDDLFGGSDSEGESASEDTETQDTPEEGGGKATLDLGITDLYSDKLPKGMIIARIINNSPEALTNFKTDLRCFGTGIAWSGIMGGMDIVDNSKEIQLKLAPGEEGEYNTGIQIDGAEYQYELVCEVALEDDTNQNDNVYQETIPASQP